MTPLELKVQELEKKVNSILSVTDASFIEELKRRLSTGILTIESGVSPENIAVGNVTNLGSELVADDFDGAVNLYSNGVLIGKIGYWN